MNKKIITIFIIVLSSFSNASNIPAQYKDKTLYFNSSGVTEFESICGTPIISPDCRMHSYRYLKNIPEDNIEIMDKVKVKKGYVYEVKFIGKDRVYYVESKRFDNNYNNNFYYKNKDKHTKINNIRNTVSFNSIVNKGFNINFRKSLIPYTKCKNKIINMFCKKGDIFKDKKVFIKIIAKKKINNINLIHIDVEKDSSYWMKFDDFKSLLLNNT